MCSISGKVETAALPRMIILELDYNPYPLQHWLDQHTYVAVVNDWGVTVIVAVHRLSQHTAVKQ